MAPLTVIRDENPLHTESVIAHDIPAPWELCTAGNYLPPHPKTLRCEVVSDFHRLEELSSEWTGLWRSDPRAEIFQTPEWAIAWWRSFGQGSTLCSLVVHAADKIVGIVPLLKRDNVIRFLGTPEADYADIVCEEEWAPAVLAVAFKTLRESVTGWSECVLQHLSENSRVLRHCRALPRQFIGSLHCVLTERYHTIIFRDERDAVFSSLLGKNHTRRRWNKLQKAGQVRFRHLETQEEAKTYLDDFFRHHVRRQAIVGKRSPYAAPESCHFMRALIEKLGPMIRFGTLELDSRPLAWHFGFQVNGKFLLYQHTFDLDASDYTPGELLFWNLFQYSRNSVAREFDFGKGDEFYKDRFANYSRETFSLFVEPPGLAGRIQGLGRTIQGFVQPPLLQLKQITKRRPAMLRAFRSLRMWTEGVAVYIRQARANGPLLRRGFHIISDLLRNSIWSKRSIVVFAPEELRNSSAKSFVGEKDLPDLEVSAAGLGDLVDLALQHPEVLLLSELSRCRERLKKGDQVYIARQKSRVVILCWLTNGTVAANACSTPSVNVKPRTVAMTMDECWYARGSDMSRAYRLLLSVLTRVARGKNADLLIHCDSDQPTLRSELERLGFRPRSQIIRRKFLSRFRRDSVLLPSTETTLLAAS
jgi:CelD/BcsL family acetyltransferase involved in cellulose biosynthesis